MNGHKPAFPRDGDVGGMSNFGMTYREWLIGCAIQGLCAALTDYPRGSMAYGGEEIATDAIEVVDEVLKKLEGP